MGFLAISAAAAAGEGTGTLHVASRPAACIVQVDGNRYEKGEDTLVVGELAPGEYVVDCAGGGASLRQQVTIRAGQPTAIFFNLQAAGAKTASTPIERQAQADMHKDELPPESAAEQILPPSTASPAPTHTAVVGGKAKRDGPVAPSREASSSERAAGPADALMPPAAGNANDGESMPPSTSTLRSIPDADDTYRAAEVLRQAVNPFAKPKRYTEAARLYRKILDRWPESDKVEAAHYRLGQIAESVYNREYAVAIREYETVLAVNPKTRFYPRWRIAVLYDNRLGDYARARVWYERAAQYAASDDIREKATERAALMRERGF